MSTARSSSALILEDDPDFRDLLTRMLRPWDLRLVFASTCREARLLVRESFDLYLVDFRLADGDSEEILLELKRQGADVIGRCIILTSYPFVAAALTDVPVVPKTALTSLYPHIAAILGVPAASAP